MIIYLYAIYYLKTYNISILLLHIYIYILSVPITHTIRWPLDMQTFGGGFLYHQAPDLIHLGRRLGLYNNNIMIMS